MLSALGFEKSKNAISDKNLGLIGFEALYDLGDCIVYSLVITKLNIH